MIETSRKRDGSREKGEVFTLKGFTLSGARKWFFTGRKATMISRGTVWRELQKFKRPAVGKRGMFGGGGGL